MKRVMLFLTFVLMFGTASVALSQGNGTDQPVVITLHCYGSKTLCASWHHPGSNVWHNINGLPIYEDPYPWGLAQICPTDSQSAESIFIFDENSTSTAPTGVGYVNTHVCADDGTSTYSFVKNLPGQQVYTDYNAWKAASDGHVIE